MAGKKTERKYKDSNCVQIDLVDFTVHNVEFLEVIVRITDGNRKPRDVHMWINEKGDPLCNDSIRIPKEIKTVYKLVGVEDD